MEILILAEFINFCVNIYAIFVLICFDIFRFLENDFFFVVEMWCWVEWQGFNDNHFFMQLNSFIHLLFYVNFSAKRIARK